MSENCLAALMIQVMSAPGNTPLHPSFNLDLASSMLPTMIMDTWTNERLLLISIDQSEDIIYLAPRLAALQHLGGGGHHVRLGQVVKGRDSQGYGQVRGTF